MKFLLAAEGASRDADLGIRPDVYYFSPSFSVLRFFEISIPSHSSWLFVGFRFFFGFRLTQTVEGVRLAEESLKRVRVYLLALRNIDGAPGVAFQAGVEQSRRVLQRSALGEGHLHDALVGLASADHPLVIPNRNASPLPFFHHIRDGLFDEPPYLCQCIAPPVTQLGDPFADELGGRLTCCLWLTFHFHTFRFSHSGVG